LFLNVNVAISRERSEPRLLRFLEMSFGRDLRFYQRLHPVKYVIAQICRAAEESKKQRGRNLCSYLLGRASWLRVEVFRNPIKVEDAMHAIHDLSALQARD
jgi:hypothetical protein